MNSLAVLDNRAVLAVSGADSVSFLQGLVSNDVRQLAPEKALYAALLTPQGKISFDFLLYERDSTILLDCAGDDAWRLQKRLSMYKLRAKIEIARRDDLAVVASWSGAAPNSSSWSDPRVPALGWRAVVSKTEVARLPASAYTAHRLELGVPEGADFGQDALFALDAGLEELHGVSFDKGCYVGQELTARMKHRGTARKRLLPIAADGDRLPGPGTPVTAAQREIGSVTSAYDCRGFALLRLDRLDEVQGLALEAAGIPIRVGRPAWLFP